MRIDELLNLHYDSLSENEKYVCHYLGSHYNDCAVKSLGAFAADCNVSKSLLVRFAKKLGLSGYSELKARIRLERAERGALNGSQLDDVIDSYHKMIDGMMRKDLTCLFDKLYQADRVFIYGSGASQERAASEMKRIFLPLKNMTYVHGNDMCRSLQNVVRENDLVFLISLSGETTAVVQLAKVLRVNHVPAVSITRLRSNTLASLCGENLYVHSIQIPTMYDQEYETATPCFILIEFLYLMYQDYLTKRLEESVQNFNS